MLDNPKFAALIMVFVAVTSSMLHAEITRGQTLKQ
jgi:hypothetical protein